MPHRFYEVIKGSGSTRTLARVAICVGRHEDYRHLRIFMDLVCRLNAVDRFVNSNIHQDDIRPAFLEPAESLLTGRCRFDDLVVRFLEIPFNCGSDDQLIFDQHDFGTRLHFVGKTPVFGEGGKTTLSKEQLLTEMPDQIGDCLRKQSSVLLVHPLQREGYREQGSYAR